MEKSHSSRRPIPALSLILERVTSALWKICACCSRGRIEMPNPRASWLIWTLNSKVTKSACENSSLTFSNRHRLGIQETSTTPRRPNTRTSSIASFYWKVGLSSWKIAFYRSSKSTGSKLIFLVFATFWWILNFILIRLMCLFIVNSGIFRETYRKVPCITALEGTSI